MTDADDRLDFTEACHLTEEILDRLNALSDKGARLNIETNNKQVNAAKAEINRELLYLSHLSRMLDLAVMNEYHRFKGEHPPEIHNGH